MGVPVDALLYEQQSTEFATQRHLETDRDMDHRRKREEVLVEEGRLQVDFKKKLSPFAISIQFHLLRFLSSPPGLLRS